MKKMKLILALLTGLALVGVTSNVLAADANAKEVTITGSMVCGKCTLHETEKCQNVVQAEKDGKIGQDDSRAHSERVQKMTDETIATIDRLLAEKETEILQV